MAITVSTIKTKELDRLEPEHWVAMGTECYSVLVTKERKGYLADSVSVVLWVAITTLTFNTACRVSPHHIISFVNVVPYLLQRDWKYDNTGKFMSESWSQIHTMELVCNCNTLNKPT